jgi:hypothetical protein
MRHEVHETWHYVFAQPAPRHQQLQGLTPNRPSQLSKISLELIDTTRRLSLAAQRLSLALQRLSLAVQQQRLQIRDSPVGRVLAPGEIAVPDASRVG